MTVVQILIFSVLLAKACARCCWNVILMCINSWYLDGPTIFMLQKITSLWIKWQSSSYTTVSSAAINLYSIFTYAHWWVTIVPVFFKKCFHIISLDEFSSFEIGLVLVTIILLLMQFFWSTRSLMINLPFELRFCSLWD